MRWNKIFVALAFGLMVMLTSVEPAYSCRPCTVCGRDVSSDQMFGGGYGTVDVIENHLDAEFNAQQIWMISILFEDNILPAMMLMAEQLTVVAMHQVMIFGSFMDAKHQLESQRLLQQLQARAHKDYHPSVGMCEFGSATKSLAASERRGEVNALVLSQRSQDRQLGSTYTSAMYGIGLDKESRLEQFRGTYCDPWDQNNAMWLLCRGTVTPGPTTGGPDQRDRFNKDIDYARTVDAEWTLNVDFTDANLTPEEEDVIALAAYLYAHDVFARVPAAMLDTPVDNRVGDQITDMQIAYMDMRSIVAKRSVAENSYNAIVGMKSSGTEGSREYLVAMLEELGITDPDDINQYLGNPTGTFTNTPMGPSPNGDEYYPSYYAQMEILTKKLYQNPDFYTNLYDKPANVARKKVAMQAIGLMQKFDMFKSYLRSEASLSVLLELAVMDLQEDIENEISEVDGSAARNP